MKLTEGFRLRQVMGQHTLVGEGLEQINFNKLITLNPSAAYLWQSVESREFTVEDLAALLIERYKIERSNAMHDAVGIAQEWTKNGIIQL